MSHVDSIRTSRPILGSRVGFFAVILALLAVGSWPWVGVCTLRPQTYDAAVWIANGSPKNPDVWNWIIRGPHFIGYRPATALSFTLDGWLWGIDPPSYNLANLAIHLAAACAVGFATRRLAPGLPPWAALLAMGVFLAHPVAEEVAPQAARRSYALVTLFALVAVGVQARGVDRACADRIAQFDWGRAACIALLVAAAVWSHELGIILVVVLPASLWLSAHAERASIRKLIIPAGGVLLAGAIAFISGLIAKGGIGGHNTREPLGAGRFLASLGSTPKYLLWMDSLIENTANASATWPALLIGAAVIVLLAGFLVRPGELIKAPEKRAALTCLIWTLGLILLFSFQNVWYGRLVYPVAAPWAILLAITAAAPALPKAARAAACALIAWLIWHSPLLHGLSEPRAQNWRAVDRVLRQAESDLEDLSGPAYVRLVLPYHAPPRLAAVRDDMEPKQVVPLWLPAAEVWLAARRRERDFPPIHFTRFLFATQEDALRDDVPVGFQPAPALALQLEPNRNWFVCEAGRNALLTTGSEGYSIKLNDLHWPDGAPGYLYILGRPPIRMEMPGPAIGG